MKTIRPIRDESTGLITIRDPMILPVGDTYYLTGTQPPLLDGHQRRRASVVHEGSGALYQSRRDPEAGRYARGYVVP